MNADAAFRAAHLLAALGLLVLAVLAGADRALAQGPGVRAESARAVAPGRAFAAPRDHAPHPAFRSEGWHVAANLEDAAGAALGLRWTLSRQALAPSPQTQGWAAPQLWTAHAAVTTPDAHRFARKLARGGVGRAGAAAPPFRAWIDDWRFESLSADPAAFAPLRLSARGEGFAYDLTVTEAGPFALLGTGGRPAGPARAQAGRRHANPFLAVEGTVSVDGEVRAVTGLAWLDRRWSSPPLDADPAGWDRFALHLPQGEKLVLHRLRDADGGHRHASDWIAADGAATPLTEEEVAIRPLRRGGEASREVVAAWRIEIPGRGLSIRTAPLNPESRVDAALAGWAGPIRFEGSHAGVGHLETTGR